MVSSESVLFVYLFRETNKKCARVGARVWVWVCVSGVCLVGGVLEGTLEGFMEGG